MNAIVNIRHVNPVKIQAGESDGRVPMGVEGGVGSGLPGAYIKVRRTSHSRSEEDPSPALLRRAPSPLGEGWGPVASRIGLGLTPMRVLGGVRLGAYINVRRRRHPREQAMFRPYSTVFRTNPLTGHSEVMPRAVLRASHVMIQEG